ncbi:ParB/RepB/Spo0J family partition protein [Ethanoligenens harbinense]|uniref:ParB-like partition protein n=1 Tax=Ethanoligenens harbinense (strain DSM 18485 / JCM 12961 / CGMCC 1.5033 / YUAN-3) TaxID=663278 RepID=E6U8G5_ETHHY|nr:ParB/RepB/Spo0J family partition protein [Ethanoligenens harbinense]ADU28284.1 parB-like partition protein [Ethanoligenens harbinense YUAN-3]AVQ97278.1 nucleoid occlusion protein [Ethanoligenens harbinense YUAN-3]AYF39942.1 nucleoid occlusion protein [Ethanoligenens harbinense]AYF42772.1 nucleoid occlusion protein [Ethanoligenens harbinense]QCN93522.1 ParB/RepB/Spo0J family partition protein [Ethanoligenens harbinense]
MFGIAVKEKAVRVIEIPIAQIRPSPWQPRRLFDEQALQGLAESIQENGILQPLSVRNIGNGMYELVAGERRLRALRLVGYKTAPCILLDATVQESAVFALLENLQRQDLHFFEEAESMCRLVETVGMTQEQVAAKLGKSQPTIANKLRLLQLTPEVRDIIMEKGLTERHARALLRLPPSLQAAALQRILNGKLNVAETDRLVEEMLNPPHPHPAGRSMPLIKDVRLFFNTMSNAVKIMKRSGIDAETTQRECGDYIEYVVRIPKGKRKSA